MQVSNGASTSVWMAGAQTPAQMPEFPPLEGDIETEICVVGAGIAGVTTAYRLAREGRRVMLIDALEVGAGETARTTAHFFPPDEWYAGLEDMHGAGKAALVAQAFAAATDWVERTVAGEGIACEFQRVEGYLYSLPGKGGVRIDREYEAATRAAVSVERLPRVPGLGFDTGPCVRYPDLAQFHPLKYLAGLIQALRRDGVNIHGRTRATDIRTDGDRQVVLTEHGNISATAVVVATNTPFNNRVALHTKQAAYRTYVIGMGVPKGSVPRILLWDTGDPYYYLRLESVDAESGEELLIVGGGDHKVGQDTHPEHRYADIEQWVRERFPMVGETRFRWSGEVMEPADGLAFLGRNPLDDRNVYVISGDSGNGMTHCTLGAWIVSDLIQGRDNPWVALYDPGRMIQSGVGTFVQEQANTLAQYRDWVTPGDVASVGDIPAGQGAVVRDDLKKLAVYRDPDGALHVFSARCRHLGCVVHWNSAENSWDCPCHGSRSASVGEVLHGPAAQGLEPAALPPER